jgi:hypothetical protein
MANKVLRLVVEASLFVLVLVLDGVEVARAPATLLGRDEGVEVSVTPCDADECGGKKRGRKKKKRTYG